MTLAAKRRTHARAVLLDRSLEEFPLFRLSDTSDDAAISYTTDDGGRWRRGLVRILRFEAATLLVVLLAAAVLSNTEPPGDA